MKQSIAIVVICASLIMAQSCQSGAATAPLDDDMIKSFQANRSEFEFWKNVFNRPDQNCRIERTLGFIYAASSPCVISDKRRLSKFMHSAGIITIEARWVARGTGSDGPVVFLAFATGTVVAGQAKEYVYNPDYQGPLEKDLDVYNWDLLKKSDELPSGRWHRVIEDRWYLVYTAG
jgi:hypothetical protein